MRTYYHHIRRWPSCCEPFVWMSFSICRPFSIPSAQYLLCIPRVVVKAMSPSFASLVSVRWWIPNCLAATDGDRQRRVLIWSFTDCVWASIMDCDNWNVHTNLNTALRTSEFTPEHLWNWTCRNNFTEFKNHPEFQSRKVSLILDIGDKEL